MRGGTTCSKLPSITVNTAANWVDANFPEPDKAKKWLKDRRPDLYDKLFPANREMTPRQREILALLTSLQKSRGMGLVLITHDLRLVQDIADRVLVMDYLDGLQLDKAAPIIGAMRTAGSVR